MSFTDTLRFDNKECERAARGRNRFPEHCSSLIAAGREGFLSAPTRCEKAYKKLGAGQLNDRSKK
jgi:hypothetical protein